uniref:Integrase, catalytic region, zinc finger, CCHC-type, peptidase aspartic, catalytic n=1 Tax=Tanacetum cinerariifolium TaxID=118510 RepID=A0A699KMB9_TANCI|nr:hypothetical protein [Tanacetum cinerariifolium]
MACDVSWKSRLSKLNDENMLLKTQVDSVVQERENIKLEYQKIFNSTKVTQTQHQKELDELIEHVNQKTYAYADVRAQNQDLLITISELKNKLQTVDKEKIVNAKFDKSETSETLLYVTPFPKNIIVKTVNALNDGSNIVCVSCGNDVFLLSHEKCVARYALSRNSSVKRASFTTPIVAKSKNLRATPVVAKSRLSVAKTLTATNKVSSVVPLSSDSSQSRTLSNYMKKKIATSRKWQKWFENKHYFNWTPKSKTAQSLSSETKSRIPIRSTSNTPVATQKWVAKLSILPSAFVLCDACDLACPLDC